MKKPLIVITLLMTLINSAEAYAVPILSFDNNMSDVNRVVDLGDTLTLDLWISGLDVDDLGGFDFSVTFDGAVTSLMNASKNMALTEFDIFNLTPALNQVTFDGVSLFADLTTQADAFRLASFSFAAASIGNSVLMLENVLLSDAFGFELSAQSFVANVTVRDPAANPIPEPQIFVLFLAGALLISHRQRLQAFRNT